MNLVKFKTELKTMKPTLWDYILLVVSAAMCVLTYDLQEQFSIELSAFGGFNASVCFISLGWIGCWFLTVLVFLIICKVKKINYKDIECEKKDDLE